MWKRKWRQKVKFRMTLIIRIWAGMIFLTSVLVSLVDRSCLIITMLRLRWNQRQSSRSNLRAARWSFTFELLIMISAKNGSWIYVTIYSVWLIQPVYLLRRSRGLRSMHVSLRNNSLRRRKRVICCLWGIMERWERCRAQWREGISIMRR